MKKEYEIDSIKTEAGNKLWVIYPRSDKNRWVSFVEWFSRLLENCKEGDVLVHRREPSPDAPDRR